MKLETRFSERTKVYWLDGTSICRGQVVKETFSVRYPHKAEISNYAKAGESIRDKVTHYCVINPDYFENKDSMSYLDKKDMLCRVPVDLVYDSFDAAVDELTNRFNSYIECEIESEKRKLEREERMKERRESKEGIDMNIPSMGPYTGPVVYATVTDCNDTGVLVKDVTTPQSDHFKLPFPNS